jgi:phage regulator Rha-like protein
VKEEGIFYYNRKKHLSKLFFTSPFNSPILFLNMDLKLIASKIYEIRGLKVILDFDLADLYGIETKVLKQAINRNIKRFPIDFMFCIDNQEFRILRSQIVTSRWGGNRRNPYAFTEHGVAMIASVLRSEQAIQMNIEIVRAFIAMRKLLFDVQTISTQLENIRSKIGEHDSQLNEIYNTLENLLDQNFEKQHWDERNRIGFKQP